MLTIVNLAHIKTSCPESLHADSTGYAYPFSFHMHIREKCRKYFSFQEKSLTFFCCPSPAAQIGRFCTSSKACRASSAFKASTTCKIRKNTPKNFYNPERIIIFTTQENKNNSCHFIRCFSLQIRPKTLISCTSKGILCLRTSVSGSLLPARL